MVVAPVMDEQIEALHLAGELVPAGIYRRVGSPQVVRLERADYLPASVDGSVACYRRVTLLWDELRRAA